MNNSVARLGLQLLVLVFVSGSFACLSTLVMLGEPGTPLDSLWRFEPQVHARLDDMGVWAVLLMVLLGTLAFVSAIGLGARAPWSRSLAAAVLSVGVAVAVVGAAATQQAHRLIVLPIGGAMVHFLLSEAVRGQLIEPPVEE